MTKGKTARNNARIDNANKDISDEEFKKDRLIIVLHSLKEHPTVLKRAQSVSELEDARVNKQRNFMAKLFRPAFEQLQVIK